MKPEPRPGFTLIELMIVIGLISILASTVIIAVNPARQFAQARNTRRRSDVRALSNAIYENIIENKGDFDPQHICDNIPTDFSAISSKDTDLYDCLVPLYIGGIPCDPSAGYFNSKTDYDSKYIVKKAPDSWRVIVCAPFAELGEFICSTEVMVGKNWYDLRWSRRRPITISGSSSNLIDYQVKININYDSDMQLDFDDLRFTKDDGITEIPYWLETKTDGNSATVWVKVPEIPTSGTTIYMYYGNSSVSTASSGEAVFDFFDDFKDLTGWLKVNLGTGDAKVTIIDDRSVVKINQQSDFSFEGGIKSVQSVNIENKVLEALVKGEGSGDLDFSYGVGESDLGKDVSRATSNLCHFIGDIGGCSCFGDGCDERQGYFIGGAGGDSLGSQYLETSWKLGKMSVTTEQIEVSYNNETLKSSGAPSTYNQNIVFGIDPDGCSSNSVYLDWVRIRKYSPPEPAISIGSEESFR